MELAASVSSRAGRGQSLFSLHLQLAGASGGAQPRGNLIYRQIEHGLQRRHIVPPNDQSLVHFQSKFKD